MEPLAGELPSVSEVEAALAASLAGQQCPEYITFSGNGEPTLHPRFAEMVEVAIRVRDRLAPRAKTCVLSNATALDRPQVVAAVMQLDVRIMKLDAGTEERWLAINRPSPELNFARLLAGLRELRQWVLQAIFFEGPLGNTSPEQVEQWAERLGEIRPRAAQIYTVDRPVAEPQVKSASVAVLNEIAAKARQATGIPVEVYGEVRRGGASSLGPDEPSASGRGACEKVGR